MTDINFESPESAFNWLKQHVLRNVPLSAYICFGALDFLWKAYESARDHEAEWKKAFEGIPGDSPDDVRENLNNMRQKWGEVTCVWCGHQEKWGIEGQLTELEADKKAKAHERECPQNPLRAQGGDHRRAGGGAVEPLLILSGRKDVPRTEMPQVRVDLAGLQPSAKGSQMPVRLHGCGDPCPQLRMMYITSLPIERNHMSKPLIDQIVDHFLACPLPETVKADPCACNPQHPHRTGTNLLTAAEARQMLERVLNETDLHTLEKIVLRDADGFSSRIVRVRGGESGLDHTEIITQSANEKELGIKSCHRIFSEEI